MKRLAAKLLPPVLAALLLAPGAAADPGWNLEQPPAPSGPLKVPLGKPTDLKFIAPNRGLLAVEGNATIPPGLFAYDGTGWHQLATVCGGSAQTTRIAIAGPREFWTITAPSKPRTGDGTALCHFKDGNVVASYSTAPESPDPYQRMDSAACSGPSDCWFGGFSAQDPTGERLGAFHLHWDGTSLETVYAPQGRGVTDIEALNDTFYETVLVGSTPGDASDNVSGFLFEPEGDHPRLIHRIQNGVFTNDLFLPQDLPAVPPSGSELLALGSDGTKLWAVGGGAGSGPAAPAGGRVPRPPLAVRLQNGTWTQVAFDASPFALTDRFADVAPVPGTNTAWVAVDREGDLTRLAEVARISAEDGTVAITRLPDAGPGRGSAAKIAFTAPNEGWMVTSDGWLFHYSDPAAPPLVQDTDPAFRGPITFRPNEAAEQFVPDTPPADDSELFKPPPVEIQQPPGAGRTKRIAPLLRHIKTRLAGKTLTVQFTLTRKARVTLIARRKKQVVARTRPRTMRPGRHALHLRLDARRWPQRLKLSAQEPGVPSGDGGGGGVGGGDTITTGGDVVSTGAGRR
jgi:hypothetical protein